MLTGETTERTFTLSRNLFYLQLDYMNLLVSCIPRLMLMILECTHNKLFHGKCKFCAPFLAFKSPQKLEVYFGHSSIKNNQLNLQMVLMNVPQKCSSKLYQPGTWLVSEMSMNYYISNLLMKKAEVMNFNQS